MLGRIMFEDVQTPKTMLLDSASRKKPCLVLDLAPTLSIRVSCVSVRVSH